MAAVVLLELSGVQLTALVMGAMWAQKAVRPSPLKEGVAALVFAAVEGEERVEADSFLELHWLRAM